MNILLIDDHQLFMDGMGFVLENLAENIAVTKATGKEQAKIFLLKDWDLILLDISMPDLNGFSLLKDIRRHNRFVKVVMISSSEDEADIEKSQSLGASGFLSKSYSCDRIIECLNEIINDGSSFLSLSRCSDNKKSLLSKLKAMGITKKQFEVLLLLDQGYSNHQIAERQSVSVSTVKSHLADLFRILNVKTRIQCVNYARQIHLL